MKFTIYLLAILFSASLVAKPVRSYTAQPLMPIGDENLWLEDVSSERSLDWVKSENQLTLNQFTKTSLYKKLYNNAEQILTANDEIPVATIRGAYAFNYWTNEQHIYGVWRRSRVSDYLAGSPVWENILSIDQLREDENKPWVFKGASCLKESTKCLISLSNGGKDAVEVREFDLRTKSFVENGFFIPEARTQINWVSESEILFSSTIFPDQVTPSGYFSRVYRFKRGESYTQAQEVFKANKNVFYVAVAWIRKYKGRRLILVNKSLSWSETQNWFLYKGEQIKVQIPLTASAYAFTQGQFIFQIKKEYVLPNGEKVAPGSVLSSPIEEVLSGEELKTIHIVSQASKQQSIVGIYSSKENIFIKYLTDVKAQLKSFKFNGHQWLKKEINTKRNGNISIASSSLRSSHILFTYKDFLTPKTLFHITDQNLNPKIIYQNPHRFKADDLIIEQKKVKSKDGVLIPYFLIRNKNIKYNSKNPTMIYGYGGFEISIAPFYSGTWGKLWLERGGVIAVTNIRGGGEYGPQWHRSAILQNKQKSYDDFIAISQDLIKQKITDPQHLGSMGGSNGGLLVGATFIQRPDLYNAVVCSVPLLDMFRYHKLLVGASWMGEYGNPDDPVMRKVIAKYSPYQNIKANQSYPEVLFTSSTKDDRVHPAHARKMLRRMKLMGYNSYLYENIVGGHGGSSGAKDKAKTIALEFSYLSQKLDLK